MKDLGLASTRAAAAAGSIAHARTEEGGGRSAATGSVAGRGPAAGHQGEPASPERTAAASATVTGAASPRAQRRQDLPVRRLAHFVIDDKLGAGGMGEVYRARDLSLDRQVAIKLLPEAVSGDAGLRERFVSEARAQARIRHPNVCHIYFIGEEAGRLFFAMELVAGRTLADRLREDGPMDPDDALEVAIGIARGLRAAAEEGFIHRDIKPSNIILGDDGSVKILDFGLVRLGGAHEGDGDPSQTRSAVGTPLYMSPEQSRGDAVDFRTDVYSLGATLHELVAGRPPFAASTVAELRSAHASDARPLIRKLRKKAPRTTAVIDEICDRMMAKDAGDRFQSYDELLAVLEGASTQRTPPVRALPRWLAFFVDFVAIAFLVAMCQVGLSLVNLEMLSWADELFMLAIAFTYFPLALLTRGRTLGMAAFNLKLVASDGTLRLSREKIARRLWWQWSYIIVGTPLALLILMPSFRDVELGAADGNLTIAAHGILELVPVLGFVLIGYGIIRGPVLGVLARRAPRMRTRWDRKSKTEVVLDVSRGRD